MSSVSVSRGSLLAVACWFAAGSLLLTASWSQAAAGEVSSAGQPTSTSRTDLPALATYPETARLSASDAQSYDHFGWAVAASGNTIVVGSISGNGVHGDPVPDSGAAYVYEGNMRQGGSWQEAARLYAGDAQPGDAFGSSLSISGDTIVVGAYREDGGDGDPLIDAGAVYVFERNLGGPDNWGQSARLAPSVLMDNAQFGYSVSIDGNTVAGGSPFNNIFPGPPLGWAEAGIVFIFERDQGGPGSWGEAAWVIADDFQEEDHFGMAVSLQGDTLVAGAADEDGGPGDPLPGAGAVYIYERDQGGPGNWGQTRRVSASDAQAGDAFGAALGISGDILAVGAWYEDGGPGDPALSAGAAYVFERHTGGWGQWGQAARLSAGDAQPFDMFGQSAAISLGTLVVGAGAEDGGTGDPLPNAGAAYVFEKTVVFSEMNYFPLVLR